MSRAVTPPGSDRHQAFDSTTSPLKRRGLYPGPPAASLTLVVKHSGSISNAISVHLTRGPASISLPFKHHIAYPFVPESPMQALPAPRRMKTAVTAHVVGTKRVNFGAVYP